MVINAKKLSDVVLIYDQYYDKKPKAALLLLERVALCCGVCLCAMMFLLAEYRLPVSRWSAAGLSLFFSAGFSLLFVFVKKRFAIPAVVGLCGVIALFNRGTIAERLSYFMDALWLLMDGRFIPGKILVDHDLDMLTPDSLMFCEGTAFGFGLIIFLFSMITAACMTPKPQVFPSLIIWILLWTPVLVSEKFTFSGWIIPTLALYMGAAALTSVYGQGIALGKPFGGSYHEAAARSERSFFNSLARVSSLKQVEMRTAYFSKYFSTAMYAAALFAALGIVAGGVLSSSSGIDYTGLYDLVRDIGERSPFTNPFERGPASEWFTEPADGSIGETGSLSITTPGRGNQEILRVKNMGDSVVYLRGDIGIDFTGEDWTSPVSSEPRAWRSSGLAEYYRPVEVQILHTLYSMLDSTDEGSSVSTADVTVDYLCDSTVTFLPAYTSDFGYFDNEMFKIYGDFVARVNEGYDKMDSVYCTALVPDYTNMDDSLTAEGLESLRRAAEFARGSGGVSDILDSGGYFTGHENSFTQYKEYVGKTYMDVPDKYRGMIREYISGKGFYNKAAATGAYDEDEIISRYLIAEMVANYLRTNYTYSLNVNNSGNNPLDSFLNETKSGHCAMYASSMTLILREMGIPARYCTGFVVQPNGGKPTVLRSKNLHAWVEVYLDELGWVTFDPTSSSQLGGNPGEISRPENSAPSVSSTSESSSSPESSGESSRDPESSSEPDKTSFGLSSGEVPPPDKPDINVMPYFLIILAVIAVLIPVLLSIRYYKRLKERAVGAIKKIRASGNTDILLEKILAVMRICGVCQNAGEMPGRFYARAEKEFGCSIKDYRGVLRAAAFSGEALDGTDCARLAGLLERLYNAAEKRLRPFGRIRLRRALLSRKSS